MSDKTNAQPGESHKRRIFWGLLFGTVILLFLFFVIPNFVDTPLRISEETTILTEPRTSDGRRIDYLAVLEERFGLKNPSENGFREIAAATGRVPMENTSQEYWDELCRKLDIDPYAPPTMPFVVWAERPLHEAAHRESGSEEPFEKPPGVIAALPPELQNSHYAWNYRGDHIRKWQEEYMAKPWCDEDFPELGECIDTLSPFLDLLGEAVRKEAYVLPIVTVHSSSMFDTLLPCVQSQRQFGRYLVIRANRSLHAGDLDAAWHDLLSALRLGRHLKKDMGLVTNFVGNAVGWMALPVMEEMLSRDDVTPEQLRQWLDDLKNLPQPNSSEEILLAQHFGVLDYLLSLSSGDTPREYILGSLLPDGAENVLGFDWALCARLVNRDFEKIGEIFAKDLTPAEKRAEFDAWLTPRPKTTPSELRLFISKGYRSRLVVEGYASGFVFFNLDTLMVEEVKTQLLIFALELELEKRQSGRYPATLEFLNGRYTPEQLADPFGKTPFVYRSTESGDGYLLYSVGQNGIDDGGKCAEQGPAFVATSGTGADDIVIEMP